MTPHRIFNLSAGPGTLPLEVLEEVQRDLLDYRGAGMSVMEMSHRSPEFDGILAGAEQGVRRLLGLGGDHHVLFLQGGASLQFLMVPTNFLPEGGSADYVVTGKWAEAALAQAARLGDAREAASTAPEGYARLPTADEIAVSEGSAYLHFTSNNTISGTQWKAEPPSGAVPLVCDASSDFLSRPLDLSRYGLLYAGAQKNAGPAGTVVVVVAKDFLERRRKGLPEMLDYGVHADKGSCYNTPPCFSIYVVGLVTKWLEGLGGLEAIAVRNRRKAALLYDAIDAGDFYRGTAAAADRSLMNVTFRLPSEEHERRFLAKAAEQGFSGLKGHRSVGGLRASIYNAFPEAGVEALVALMREFERSEG